MNPEEIRSYWDGKAEALETDPSATMKDVILRDMEIEAIESRLSAEDNLIDVGGGNGFAGIRWAKTCASVRVVDYSPRMVENARKASAEAGQDNITVEEGSVLDLSAYEGSFSAATCVRCLINLPESVNQLEGVGQLAGTLAPGGRLFLIEGLEDTFAAMNAARESMGLPAVQLDWHNTLLEREELEAKLSETLTIEERVDFGEYYFLSRVIHPLLVAPEEPKFDGRMNHIARELWQKGTARERFPDLSTLVLYVCRKK